MRSRSPGRYEPLQLLGHGPYGSVNLARDAFGGRLVAVKVLDPHVLPARAIRRLQGEFTLRRGLRHPHIAAFCELDFDDAGNCRLVSEYVAGEDFATAASGLDPDALIDLAVQLLQALGHLHDCGLVHGAIKPTNVRVGRADDSRTLKLLDFDLRADNEVSPSEPAAILQHSAPEVLRGQAADLRADLYGVGMLLHQAISGKLPFEDPEHGPGIVGWHLSRDVRRAPEGHVLTGIVEKLLHPDPEQRFGSAHEVIRAMGLASGRRLRSRATVGGEQVLITGRFVGRDREMKRLAAVCRRILNGGGAQIILLRGPQGIGKTRALEECRVVAQMAGIRVVQAACGQRRSAPLSVLRDLLHQVLVLVGPDHAAAEAHASVLHELMPDLYGGRAGSGATRGEHDWMRIKNGVAEFLASAAQLRPLVLLVDDIHSIDEASLAVLRWVFQHFSGCPLLLIGAFEEQDPSDPRGSSSRVIENDAHEVVRLGALESADVEQILAGVLALPGSVHELGGLVLSLTGGVPLYVEELVRSLVEGQMMDLLAQTSASPADDGKTGAHERAVDLVSARIDRLPEPAQRVLEGLCIFEGAASEADLSAALALKNGDFAATIHRLESADLVRVEPTSAGTHVAIRTSLFREAVSTRIPAERIAALHDGVVDRLESSGPSEGHTSEIAYHAIRGTRAAKAAESCLEAAREAVAFHAYGRARDLLEPAKKLAETYGDQVLVAKIVELLAETLECLGESEAALLVLGETASAPESSKAQIAAARLKICEIQTLHGRTSAAERSLTIATAEAAEVGDCLLVSRADRLLARILVRKGSPARALTLLERARTVLESQGDPAELARVASEIGEVHSALGENELARACHRESLERSLRLRDKSGVALAHLHLGLVDWTEARSEDALARLDRCERLARRIGHYQVLARAMHHRGVIEAGLGRLADAVRTLTLSLSMMRRLEDEAGICDGLVQLGRVHHASGRHEMARMLVEEVIARRGRLNDLSGVAGARVLLGRLLCVIGSLDDAETLLRTAADAAEQLGLDGIAVDALTGLADVALMRNQPAEALAILDRQERLAQGRPGRLAAPARDLIRAEIAFRTTSGDRRAVLSRLVKSARAHRNADVLAEARRIAGTIRPGPSGLALLAAAQDYADRAGLRELAWRVRADLGRRLLAEGDVDRAVVVMKEAMKLLRSLHDELPARRRESYLSDPRKLALRALFAEAIERQGVSAA